MVAAALSRPLAPFSSSLPLPQSVFPASPALHYVLCLQDNDDSILFPSFVSLSPLKGTVLPLCQEKMKAPEEETQTKDSGPHPHLPQATRAHAVLLLSGPPRAALVFWG